MTATRGTTFTTTRRMVDRVHRHTADGRANAEPALAAGLAQLGVLVVRVGHRTDGGHAIGLHQTLLARGQTQQGHALVLADQLYEAAGRTGHLATLARLHLHIVDDGADRDRLHRHGVAGLDVDLLAGDDAVADLQEIGRAHV